MGSPTGLVCPKCWTRVSADVVRNLCECGAPLLVEYDLKEAGQGLTKGLLGGREASMWRYWEILPVESRQHLVTMGEGWTPIVPLRRLGPALGLPELALKDEGRNPTGTFKDRGAAAGVSKALELGVRHVAMPTGGNAGGAWE